MALHVRYIPQELAVEDMRHELDDEGRREFFEEQDEDGEGGLRTGNGRCADACITRETETPACPGYCNHCG